MASAPRPTRARDESDPPPAPLSFEESHLVERARGGDGAALADLLTRHEARLTAICLRMVGERETARDLTQDAFMKAIRALDTFDGRSAFGTWLTRIAMNTCLSHLRKQKLRRHASLEAPITGEEGGGDLGGLLAQEREPGPGSGVEKEEQLRRLTRAMHGLDAEQRAILLLRDARGLDYGQIAQTLGVRVGTVKSRLFRARAQLRREMERLSGEIEAGPQ